jgi:hypothetical protein
VRNRSSPYLLHVAALVDAAGHLLKVQLRFYVVPKLHHQFEIHIRLHQRIACPHTTTTPPHAAAPNRVNIRPVRPTLSTRRATGRAAHLVRREKSIFQFENETMPCKPRSAPRRTRATTSKSANFLCRAPLALFAVRVLISFSIWSTASWSIMVLFVKLLSALVMRLPSSANTMVGRHNSTALPQ